jgi:uroporphyrinogen-III decarboxylase
MKKRVCDQSFDVDWKVSFSEAAMAFKNHPNQPAIYGNFDPVSVMLQGTGEEVYRATWACLAAAGCEIPIGTPPENMQAQNRAIQEFPLLAAQPDEF